MAQKTILVVSPDRYRSDLVRDWLEQAGYYVWVAETTQEALNAFL